MKTVVFDVGGTLLGINPAPSEIYYEIFLSRGHQITNREMLTAIKSVKGKLDFDEITNKNITGAPTHVRFNKALLKWFNLPNSDQEVDDLSKEFASHIYFTLYPETKGVLDSLQGNVRMGVISNWNLPSELDNVLEKYGLLQYFDYTLASKDIELEKPDPYIYEYALEKMSAEPSDAYYVGDSYVEDVIGPLSIGMTPIYINRRNTKCPSEIKSCDTLRGVLGYVL